MLEHLHPGAICTIIGALPGGCLGISLAQRDPLKETLSTLQTSTWNKNFSQIKRKNPSELHWSAVRGSWAGIWEFWRKTGSSTGTRIVPGRFRWTVWAVLGHRVDLIYINPINTINCPINLWDNFGLSFRRTLSLGKIFSPTLNMNLFCQLKITYSFYQPSRLRLLLDQEVLVVIKPLLGVFSPNVSAKTKVPKSPSPPLQIYRAAQAPTQFLGCSPWAFSWFFWFVWGGFGYILSLQLHLAVAAGASWFFFPSALLSLDLRAAE